MTDRMTGAMPDETMTERHATATLLLIFALVVGVSRRRTATVATIAWSVFVSRMLGAARDRGERRIMRTVTRLFDERAALTPRVDEHARRLDALDACFGGDPVAWRRRADAAAETARVRDEIDALDTGGGACA